jgi:hypothetical protein
MGLQQPLHDWFCPLPDLPVRDHFFVSGKRDVGREELMVFALHEGVDHFMDGM